MRACAILAVFALMVAVVVAQEKQETPARKMVESQPSSPAGPLDFTVSDIDGHSVPLAKYKGDVVLIVNVASKCGFTPQYKDLQALYDKYRERGLRILGFPANNFKAQEPGSNAEIKEFCQKNFGVTFDMFAKVSVKGDDICPLYKFLTSEQSNPGHGGEIAWNFTKFLVGRDGRVVARFEPKVKPTDEVVTRAVEAALHAAVPTSQPAGKKH